MTFRPAPLPLISPILFTAKVNDRRVPLDYRLQNGDMVEIELDRRRRAPSSKWLEFVVTTHARHAIQRSIREEREKTKA